MKYGLIIYGDSGNLGDDIQSYATIRFLPHIDYVIDRESLDSFICDTGEKVAVIMNGWYMYHYENWPPSPFIEALPISMHFDTYFSHLSDKDLLQSDILDGLGKKWLVENGPIGARDNTTLQLLQERGIPAFFSGCLTLTIQPFKNVLNHGKIILVDVSAEVYEKIKANTTKEVICVTHSLWMQSYGDATGRFKCVEDYLRLYQGASLVVTGRLHAALPSVALGTPVLMIDEKWSHNRTIDYIKHLNSVKNEDLVSDNFNFDFDNPPQNPQGIIKIKEKIENMCTEFINRCESNNLGKNINYFKACESLIDGKERLKKLEIKKHVKLSIIVPVYNVKQYLAECITSLLNQNINGYEIIFIDDGSTDGSDLILKEYVKRNPYICKYIFQNNSGLGPARNRGIREAKGEYIMFVDSDDWIDQYSLNGLYLFAKSTVSDLVLFDCLHTKDRNSEKELIVGYKHMTKEVCKSEAVKTSTNPAHVWQRLIKRNLLRHAEFLNIWYEDIAFMPVITSYAKRINYYKVPIYYYREREGSITSKEKDEKNLEVMKAWNYALKYCNKEVLNETIYAVSKSIEEFKKYRPLYRNEYEEWKLSNKLLLNEMNITNKLYTIHLFSFNNIELNSILLDGINVLEWNENNVDIFELPFTQQAYARKDWYNLRIYFAFKAIMQYGGIAIIGNDGINEEILKQSEQSFCWNNNFIGAPARCGIIENILKKYKEINYITRAGGNKMYDVCKIVGEFINVSDVVETSFCGDIKYYYCEDRSTK